MLSGIGDISGDEVRAGWSNDTNSYIFTYLQILLWFSIESSNFVSIFR